MDELKVGMIGLDTSHCPAFTKLLNDRDTPHHVPGARVVAAFPGGSKAFSKSWERVDKFTEQMRDELGVEIKDSIEAVVEGVDAVLLESCDGRQHLEQFRAIAPFGVPTFIDKPMATSAADVKAIIELSEKHDAPIFSSSSVRYTRGIAELGEGTEVLGCEAFGPAPILDDFPGLFWYGIHAAEALFAKMGRGCRHVVTHKTDLADVVTGTWEDGRIGTLYGFRFKKGPGFGCTVFVPGGAQHSTGLDKPPAYALLAEQYVKFFQTRQSPVDPAETLEIIAFLEAANESRETGETVAIKL